MNKEPVIIIGAGPAGLSAAYELIKHGIRPVVLESADKAGGISRTETYKGYSFDIGGHRFFTKMDAINQLWQEMLADDFLKVQRVSRIYYQDRFFKYPLDTLNALSNLGFSESILILASYLKARFRPQLKEKTFEQWVSNRFGDRLYKTFFKSYTEKVWGVPCHEIKADWAAQRIQGLSLEAAISNALFGRQKAKSLINGFSYPAKGSGMMWQRFSEAVEAGGGEVRFNSKAIRLRRNNGRIASVTYLNEKKELEIPVGQVISSMPITKLLTLFEPQVPDEILEIAKNFSYRAFVIVVLIVDKKNIFRDQWLYIHSPSVKVGRIQNFKNWSEAMVPDPLKTSLGMEYFCSEDDEIWKMSDTGLIDMASRELCKLGLAEMSDIIDGFLVRQPNAYPVYDQSYDRCLEVSHDFFNTISNLQTIGRNGMHRYNNMDHSMQTGRLAAQNILGANHDLQKIKAEPEFLAEEKEVATELFL